MVEQKNDVRFVLGSLVADKEHANKITDIWQGLGVKYVVSSASCHRNITELKEFVESIKEPIIVFIGGMSLPAPGIIQSFLVSAANLKHIVFAVPTDKAARSAIEDLPRGTAIITSGLNTTNLSHTLTNSALAIAQLLCVMGNDEIIFKLAIYYERMLKKKALIPEVELVDGLIP